MPILPVVTVCSRSGPLNWLRLLQGIAPATPGLALEFMVPLTLRDVLKADGKRWPCTAPVYPED